MRTVLIVFLAFWFVASCDRTDDKDTSYSFFIAGHTYGNPNASNLRMHPAFVEKFEFIHSYPKIEFGIFTGDLVRNSTIENWDSVEVDLAKLQIPYYVIPGNHDTYNRALYEERFGDKENQNRTYSFFQFHDDLFILLDGNLDHWNISGNQLDFLEKTLMENAPEARNIFVFVHELIWWDEANEFAEVKLNWPPYTPDTTNYWNTIEPLLRKQGKPVFICAGDLGASNQASALMFAEKDGITYLASGMGGNKDENFILANVDEKGDVRFDVIALRGELYRLGKAKDFKIH